MPRFVSMLSISAQDMHNIDMAPSSQRLRSIDHAAFFSGSIGLESTVTNVSDFAIDDDEFEEDTFEPLCRCEAQSKQGSDLRAERQKSASSTSSSTNVSIKTSTSKRSGLRRLASSLRGKVSSRTGSIVDHPEQADSSTAFTHGVKHHHDRHGEPKHGFTGAIARIGESMSVWGAYGTLPF